MFLVDIPSACRKKKKKNLLQLTLLGNFSLFYCPGQVLISVLHFINTAHHPQWLLDPIRHERQCLHEVPIIGRHNASILQFPHPIHDPLTQVIYPNQGGKETFDVIFEKGFKVLEQGCPLQLSGKNQQSPFVLDLNIALMHVGNDTLC